MRTKAIPAVVMMIAGFVTCVLSFIQQVPTGDFLKDLLIVLILFYILGIIIKSVLDFVFNRESNNDDALPDENQEDQELKSENIEPEANDDK